MFVIDTVFQHPTHDPEQPTNNEIIVLSLDIDRYIKPVVVRLGTNKNDKNLKPIVPLRWDFNTQINPRC
jgi:hypothetical protein